MKRFAIIVLSIVVLYSGVAWALDECLRHDDHLDHAVSDHHSDSRIVSSHDDSREPSVPVIHCTSVTQHAGPAARVASPKIPHSDDGTALYTVSISETLSRVIKNDLWLEALFKNIVTFPLPIDLARHLFLSVFQI